MAEFYWDCVTRIYEVPAERNDFAGMPDEGQTLCVLCEGCGMIVVDQTGREVHQREIETLRSFLAGLPDWAYDNLDGPSCVELEQKLREVEVR